jgi:hypothetical protein
MVGFLYQDPFCWFFLFCWSVRGLVLPRQEHGGLKNDIDEGSPWLVAHK